MLFGTNINQCLSSQSFSQTLDIIDPFISKSIFESNMRLFRIFRHLSPHFERQFFLIDVWCNLCIIHIKLLLNLYNYEINDDIMLSKWGNTVLNGRVLNILYKFKINAIINVLYIFFFIFIVWSIDWPNRGFKFEQLTTTSSDISWSFRRLGLEIMHNFEPGFPSI